MAEPAPNPSSSPPRAASLRARVAAAWPQIRAVLVAAHIAAMVIAAVPGPDGGMNRAVWRDATVQSELSAWSARLGTTPARLEAWVFPIAMSLFELRNLARTPVQPYVDWTGVEQPWRLFVAPDRVPSRFELAMIRRGASRWETLFDERSPTATWSASYFEHPRVRRALYWYGWPPAGARSAAHCEWVAGWVFYERPDATAVRCRFYRAPSPSPADVRAGREPPGNWTQQTIVPRGDDPAPGAPGASGATP